MTSLHPIRVERNPCNTHTAKANVSRIVGNRNDEDGSRVDHRERVDYGLRSSRLSDART